jgi:excisionase family DNA binding protein
VKGCYFEKLDNVVDDESVTISTHGFGQIIVLTHIFYGRITQIMPFFTSEQAANRLGVTVRRIQAMAQSGRLPSTRFGRALMIKESDLALVADRKLGRPMKAVAEIEQANQEASADCDGLEAQAPMKKGRVSTKARGKRAPKK